MPTSDLQALAEYLRSQYVHMKRFERAIEIIDQLKQVEILEKSIDIRREEAEHAIDVQVARLQAFREVCREFKDLITATPDGARRLQDAESHALHLLAEHQAALRRGLVSNLLY